LNYFQAELLVTSTATLTREPSKSRGRVSGLSTESGSQMAATAEPRARCDFFNAEPRFAEKKVLRRSHALSHHVCMRWNTKRLPEGTFQMPGADTCEFGKSA